MNVYNFKQLLEENGINNPLDSDLYHITDCLESIGVKISPEGPWIAGGSVMKTFMGQPLDTDIDVFFKDAPQYEHHVKIMDNNAIVSKETTFSKTYDFIIEHNGVVSRRTIQLINFVYRNKASEIIDTFDLSVCQIAFDGERIVVVDGVLDDIKNKRVKLHVDNLTQPGSTLKRIVKYAGRGFTFSCEDLDAFNHRFVIGGDPPRKPQDWS